MTATVVEQAGWVAREVPDLRLELMDLWRPPISGQRSGPLWRLGGPVSEQVGDRRWHWGTLAAAALWWVAPDMVDLLDHHAPSLPLDTTLDPTMVPDECGLVVFAHSLAGLGINPGEVVTVGAYLWGPALMASTRQPGVVMAAYSAVSYPLLSPIGFAAWPFGMAVEEGTQREDDAAVKASCIEDRRRMAALWLLTSQPGVATESTEVLPRQVARRSQRRQVDPAVRVVNLRQPRPGAAHGADAGDRQYHHRWLVSRHWRQQAYGPHHSLRRPLLVGPFLKGPPGAPLLDSERVKSWVR